MVAGEGGRSTGVLLYYIPPFSITCLVAATVAKGCKSRDALRALECRTGLYMLKIVLYQAQQLLGFYPCAL